MRRRAHGRARGRRPAGRRCRGLDDPRRLRASSGSTCRRSATARRYARQRLPGLRGRGRGRARARAGRARARSRPAWSCAPTPSASATARKLVLEFLGSSVDLSTDAGRRAVPRALRRRPRRATARRRRRPPSATARAPVTTTSRTGGRPRPCTQPVKVDNDLYVRDYAKCILCYKCVDACGEQWQNTFAIAVAGRGFDARISTEFATPLPDSACVYCGNCIAVCPTGALMFTTEHDLREAGTWDEDAPDADRHDLPLLRRRLQPHAARAGQRDRQGHVAPTTTTSPAATSASRAASASSTCRTAGLTRPARRACRPGDRTGSEQAPGVPTSATA